MFVIPVPIFIGINSSRNPVLEMVPDFCRDDVWIPPYQVRGKLLKSGMTAK
jgi:hypothetical protein